MGCNGRPTCGSWRTRCTGRMGHLAPLTGSACGRGSACDPFGAQPPCGVLPAKGAPSSVQGRTCSRARAARRGREAQQHEPFVHLLRAPVHPFCVSRWSTHRISQCSYQYLHTHCGHDEGTHLHPLHDGHHLHACHPALGLPALSAASPMLRQRVAPSAREPTDCVLCTHYTPSSTNPLILPSKPPRP